MSVKIKAEDLAKRATELFDELESSDASDTLLIMSGSLANDIAQFAKEIANLKERLYDNLMPDLSGKTQEGIEDAFLCVDSTGDKKQ